MEWLEIVTQLGFSVVTLWTFCRGWGWDRKPDYVAFSSWLVSSLIVVAWSTKSYLGLAGNIFYIPGFDNYGIWKVSPNIQYLFGNYLSSLPINKKCISFYLFCLLCSFMFFIRPLHFGLQFFVFLFQLFCFQRFVYGCLN